MESSVHPSVDFFLGATTPAGFKGYFAPLRREPGMQLVLLKSGPGCGKSTLMKRLARAAQEKGEPIQRIHCASDPDSLDGVVFLRQKRAIIDATAPHVVEPEAPGADERVLSLYHTIDADALHSHKDEVTALFAQRAAEFSTQVERDENGRFAVSRDEILARGPEVYENVAREYPFLALEGQTAAKPIFFSRLQSRLGFTGVYFPFTGEANVNVDAPVCLLPATVAHEMAHQRMVASEQEANFVGILAAVTSGDPVYQYSGYLMGLIQLCNALAPVDRAAWQDIVQRYFTQELADDWNANNAYWAALASPMEDAAEQVYDSFLKGNGQELGMRSYGACVDLLAAYFGGEQV